MEAKKKSIVNVTASIPINKDASTVFRYISNLELDKNWRKEINETVVSQKEPELGNTAMEDSFLSKKVPNHKVILQCLELVPGKKIVYESVSGSSFWLKNTREADARESNGSNMIYNIQFDAAIIKYALGFSLPLLLVKFYTKMTMKKYLAKLKQILEN